ncbi:MAG: SbcC/MukB-like Walker B domain-containing protein, partial [Bariatricus sp.]
EDMQESVMQYGRMRKRIEETLEEITCLKEIGEMYRNFDERREKVQLGEYQLQRLEMMRREAEVQEKRDRIQSLSQDNREFLEQKAMLETEEKAFQQEYDELLIRLNNSGYKMLETELAGLNEALERLDGSKARWTQTANRLKEWKTKEMTSNQTIWDIDRFASGGITLGELKRLKNALAQMRNELEEERREIDGELRRIKKEEKESREELKELKQGRKAYPKELEAARIELQNQIYKRTGTFVNVKILADLLDIRDERWHNAVEGYMGGNKLLLVVEPEYAKTAMEIYQKMDKKKYYRAAVLDTEKVLEEKHEVRPGALAEEVIAKESYVREYIRFFLGNVMKCENIEELRNQRIGVTPDCMLYHSYRLQHINPENYTRRAYIGETSLRQRIRQLEERCNKLQEERLPLQDQLEEIRKLLDLESLIQPEEDYMAQIQDARMIPEKERRKEQLTEQMKKLREDSVEALERQMEELANRKEEKKKQVVAAEVQAEKCCDKIEMLKDQIVDSEEELAEFRKDFQENTEYEEVFRKFLEARKSVNYEYLKSQVAKGLGELKNAMDDAYQRLVDRRSVYIRRYPNRTFSTSVKENSDYDKLLDSLQCDDLEKYRESAKEQARSAVEHFKDDFIFKIRSAIREAYQRRDELNRIISGLDFGKDKYQFVITRNKGADGKYYKMFMDDALQINPADLGNTMDNQLNMFTMEHEEEYGEMMNELINIFIPPENATREELDEARKNMEKYADYRTYLSFDMQQIVQGEKNMTIGLGKMIKKNSGGEGQNPLYVALLASFAQVYRINLSPKVQRRPTLRLVVLDEAFSKMDAEKVASCISLIRGLGFQAIISATNDKIQNYLENVDKTFVYANPNKRHISIQEFEKTEFSQLADVEE